MKFPAFDYASPTSLAETVRLLAERGDGAVILAGGQSLLPILAFRLASPEIIVDLKKVPGLDEIAIGAEGVRLGASVRWCDIEDNGDSMEEKDGGGSGGGGRWIRIGNGSGWEW